MYNKLDVKKDQKFWKNPMLMTLFEKRGDMEYFEVMILIEDVIGVMHNISKVIKTFNVNIRSGFHNIVEEIGDVWVVFLEMPPSTPHEELFNEVRRTKGVIDLKYVRLTKDDYFDSFFFPIFVGTKRVSIIPEEAFREIKSQLVEVLGTGGQTILYREGTLVGHNFYEYIPEELASVEAKLKFIVDLIRAIGWGLVEFVQISPERRSGEVHVEGNTEADVKYAGLCHFTRGALTSILREIFNDPSINLIETACIGKGDECCVFKLV